MPAAHWEILKRRVIRYLEESNYPHGTIEILKQVPFELWHGTNGFGDKFELLFLRTGMTRYIELERENDTSEFRSIRGFPEIATVLGKLGHEIRFIAIELNPDEDVASVSVPTLAVTSDTVEAALRDAETLIGTNGAARGVDRVHTAFHGYLESLCRTHHVEFKEDTNVMTLFSMLRQQVPSLRIADPDAQRAIDTVFRAMSKIVAALDSIRNEKSLAHPNPILLDEPEAMLVINCLRTMLHYLNAKT
jgi:hypothetical protein